MDLKNYPNITILREYSNIGSTCYHSKTNSRLTNTEESYNTIRNPNLEKDKNLRNSNEKYAVIGNSIRSSYINISNETMNDINEFDTKVFVNPSYKDRLATIDDRHGLKWRQLETSCSKKVFSCPKNSQKPKYKHYMRSNSPPDVHNDSYVNEEVPPSFLRDEFDDKFINQTLQTNVRLKKILAKIIKECRRDKQSNAWNKYINELKDKHGYYNDEITGTTQYISKDYTNTELEEMQSDPVQNLLNEIYGCDTNMSTNIGLSCTHTTTPESERVYFKNNNICYPTSSQALINMRKREFINEKHYGGNRIVIDSNFDRFYKRYNLDKIFNNKINHVKETVVQTEMNLENFNKLNVLEEKYINASEKTSNIMNTFKRQPLVEKDDTDVKSFQNVQVKLDTLIESVNSVILAVRTLLKSKDNEEAINSKPARPIPNIKSFKDACDGIPNVTVSGTKNNIREMYQTNKDFITMILQNTNRHLKISEMSTSMSQFREFTMSNMDKVIEEEMEKSKRIKKDIQELLHTRCDRQCSVQLTLDKPTKESKVINCHDSDIYLEVANHPISPETDGDINEKITIAVNTDPLSIPALLRLSTDAIKGLLSYVPHLDYNTYVSMLPLSRLSVPNYICYICGDSFSHMSQLSDHIRQHNLRNKRDCCVSRHDLCTESNQIGLFECKYCEQRFTRSYCHELHQQNCAKSLGKKHQDLSSLLYLK